MSRRVAVIGGGLGGLVAARRLLGAGFDVDVLEAADRPGGVIESSTTGGFVREHAANGALSGAAGGAVDLAAELGVEMTAASAEAKNRWILHRGGLRVLPGDPISIVTTDLLSARGKLRMLLEPVLPAVPGEVTVADFFRRRLGREVHDRVVAPFVVGIYAGDSEELSLQAAFPRLAELAARGGLVRGLLATRLGGRNRRSVGQGRPRIMAPAGGMERIVGQLAGTLESRVRLSTPVAAIAGRAGGVELTLATGRVERFDGAVCALPAHAAARILGDADGELAQLLAAIPTVPVAVVHLGYARDQIGHRLDGFGFLVAPGESVSVLGIVFESQLWPDRAPEGAVLLRCMLGGARRPELLDQTDDDLVAMARADAEAILDIRGDPSHVSSIRWPRAIAQYTLGHRERVERAERLASAHNVVLAGASYRGVAVNSIAADGQRVARQMTEILAAPLAMLIALAACSGAGTPKTNDEERDDAGLAAAAAAADAGAAAEPSGAVEGYRIVDTESSGSVEISLTYSDPPRASVGSSGVDRCGQRRRPRLSVATLGGVGGAVVWLEDIAVGRAPPAKTEARLTLTGCRIEPRVTLVPRLGAAIDVISGREQRVELALAAAGTLDEPLAVLPLAPLGRGYRVDLATPGVFRLGGDGIDPGWVVVSGTPYLALTGSNGAATLTGVPAGRYRLKVWHPPLSGGGGAIEKVADIDVQSGAAARIELDIGD